MFEASENRPLARQSDGISPGHHRDCNPTTKEFNVPNESDFMEHLRLIIEEWKLETGKEPNVLSCLNEFRAKLFGINGCSIQELLNMRQFFSTLLDFRNNDPVLLHCIKTVTYQIQRRQFQQQQNKDNMAFHSYNNIDRLAKALASLQVRNDQVVNSPVIQPQNSVPVSSFNQQQMLENQISSSKAKDTNKFNAFLGSSSITEVAKALANMQSVDGNMQSVNANSSTSDSNNFIPMPPGWNERAERASGGSPHLPNWNGEDLTSMAHTLSSMHHPPPQQSPLFRPDSSIAKSVSPLHQQQMMPIDGMRSPLCNQVIGSPPQSSILGTSPMNHGMVIRSPLRTPEVDKGPIGAEMCSDWDVPHQRPLANQYTRQPKSPEQQMTNVPTEFIPSPSEIGGDEFLEEEKPVFRNTAWRAVGCTAKPPKAPETMAAILKKSLASEPRTHMNYYSIGQHNSSSYSKPAKQEHIHTKSKSADSSGANSVDIWESSEEESEGNTDPLIDPRNPLQATSVWVGNLTTHIEKEMLYPHFMRIGYISNIVMVHENHCAFVNFENPRAAGRAMRDLQGLVVEGVKLLLRYPNRFLGGDHSVKLRDATPMMPGRPKRGGQPPSASPKRPSKKQSK